MLGSKPSFVFKLRRAVSQTVRVCAETEKAWQQIFCHGHLDWRRGADLDLAQRTSGKTQIRGATDAKIDDSKIQNNADFSRVGDDEDKSRGRQMDQRGSRFFGENPDQPDLNFHANGANPKREL